jgi:hypothetical protein
MCVAMYDYSRVLVIGGVGFISGSSSGSPSKEGIEVVVLANL